MARPAAGEPLILASEIGSAGSTSYSRYLGSDRGLASDGQSSDRGLKDVFEACVRCDAGAGLDLNKSSGGIGVWGRWQGNGYSFAGSQKTWGGSQAGSSSGGWNASQATGPVVASLAAKGGFMGDLSAEELAFPRGLFSQWSERGFNGGFPGKGIFANGGGGSSNSPTPTPEPATLALVAGGMAAAAAIRRRQQRRRSDA